MVRYGWPSVSSLSFGSETPPPPPSLVWCGNGDQTIWPYRLFTWPGRRRTGKRYLRASNLSFIIFSNSSGKQPSGRLCLGPGIRFWINAHGHGLPPFSYLIITIFHHVTTCFNPRIESKLFSFFSSCHDFARISACFLHQFPEWENSRLKASSDIAVVFMLIRA